jgi:hypothetical protein
VRAIEAFVRSHGLGIFHCLCGGARGLSVCGRLLKVFLIPIHVVSSARY